MILTLEDLPIRVRNRELRKNKYRDEREQNMNRAKTEEMRKKSSKSCGVCPQGVVKGKGEKQYFQTGKKDTGPNYTQTAKTGPLKNGGKGVSGAK